PARGFDSDAPPPPGPAAPSPHLADRPSGRSVGREGEETSPSDVSAPSRSREQTSSASMQSLGSSPSGVAEAMGRVIGESAAPATPARSSEPVDHTVFQPHGPHDRPVRKVAVAPTQEPTARGNLATTPLPHVLVYMLDHAMTGSVVFEGTSKS